MSANPLLAFWALAGLLVAAMCTILVSRNPRYTAGAEAVITGCVAGFLVLLDAPFVALIAVTCGIGGVLMTHTHAGVGTEHGAATHGETPALLTPALLTPALSTAASTRRTLRASGTIVAALLGFTWLSMMARQFLSAGVDLAEHPGFGDFAQGVQRWIRHGTLSAVMLLLGGLVAIGAQGTAKRRPS